MIKTLVKYKILDYAISVMFNNIEYNFVNVISKSNIKRVSFIRYLGQQDYEKMPFSRMILHVGHKPLEIRLDGEEAFNYKYVNHVYASDVIVEYF